MRNKILFILTLTVVLAGQVFGQNGTGTLKGTVKDNKGEPVPFANVAVKLNGNLVTGGTTDFDGIYTIKSLPPGKYDVEASYTGYQSQVVKGVVVMVDKVVFQDFSMSSGVNLKEVVVTEYKVPLIEKDAGATATTITSDDFKKMPNRSAEAAATTVAGVYSKDGSVGSIRGSRDGSSDMYIDGVKVRGGTALPQMAIEQVQVLLGGLPAQYGDVTTGIISVTTKGPSKKYFGGFEYVTSEPFDKYGYNLLAFNLSGPIFTKKDSTQSDKRRPLVGFFLAGELKYQKDPDPSALGAYKVNNSLLDSLEQFPVRPSGQLTGGSLLNAQFVRKDDIEKVKARQNVAYYGMNFAGKLDFNITKNTNFTIGGSYDANKQRIYSYANSLFNYKKNGEQLDNTSRVYARFTQRFNDNPESKSVVKNIIYMLNVDYQRYNRTLQDPDHKDRLFDYGYVGKFKTYRQTTYQYGVDPTTGIGAYLQNGYSDTLFEFTPGTINPLLANYTSQYYSQNSRNGNYNNWNQVQQGIGPLLNSEQPDNVYDLWYNTGREYGAYQKLQQEQYRITGLASADIKNHSFTLGFEYEQRVDRAVTYQAPSSSQAGFWQLINPFSGLVNKHISELDYSNPILGVDANGNFNDTIQYPFIYNQESQSYFDYNLRESLGLNPKGTDWIDVNTLSPDQLDISWFSADELLNGGNSYVSYYGYDAAGNKVKGKPSLDDFFTSKDEFGNFKRTVGAFQPIYFAGYIQDKFVFKDLIFNVGLRVDRFDANQPVLKDQWALYDTKKAGEVSTIGNQEVSHPSNIGSDYVVYVNDINNPTAIVGYRNGRNWYNAQGAPIVDPSVLRTSTGRAAPFLVDPSNQVLNAGAFKDYTPQTNFMPRISFSFPISEDALFYAHYDVLYKRPVTGIRLDPTDYYYMTVRSQDRNSPMNNPALQPEKTVDYELGFRQVLSKSSALNISAFYREIRNLIQVVNIAEAYPSTYNTYGNLDFGTVKGLSVSYEMRRTDNFQLRVNYTLQFADGTGSTTSSGLNLINSGQPNLRVPQPLDFDQRHTIQIVADYHFQKDQGFRIGKVYPLANMGFNLIGRIGSGTPYTKKRNPSPTQNLSGGVAQQVEGAINGSRYPVNFNIDLRIDKDFYFKVGKKAGEGEDKRKEYSFNLYLQILNLLNTKNVYDVYSYTGNPNDDGYLTASEFQNSINSQNDPQSFRDLYTLKVNNPNNYSVPRRIRIGLIFNF
ncbi:MAG: carboxypeptidase regulatory-like domain-containing protein [Bacteroidia bacterium]|nr:carboxypeptidase regulatory-like domain-containing protein [Bacteroidia bacterium]